MRLWTLTKMPNRLPPVYDGAFTKLYPNASIKEFVSEHWLRHVMNGAAQIEPASAPLRDRVTASANEADAHRHELLGYLLERWLAWRCNGTFDADQAKDALWKNLGRIALVDVDEDE